VRRKRAPLFHLSRCLRGIVPPKGTDWLPIIELANKSLITPQLEILTRRDSEEIPNDLKNFLEEIYSRNIARNNHLASQLIEAVSALNSVKIVPTLLKGTALLAAAYPSEFGHRILADLDLLVEPSEVGIALECLLRLGYRIDSGSPDNPDIHFVALGRNEDVGQIDLHRNLPGPESFYRGLGPISSHCKTMALKDARVRCPSATYQALVLICHDQFHDGDYRTARVDLRHLFDLHALSTSAEGVDWQVISSISTNSFVRNAVSTHILTMQALLGTSIPPEFNRHFVARFQSWRRLQQINKPGLRHILSAIALLLDCPGYLKFRSRSGLYLKDGSEKESGTTTAPTWAGLKSMFLNSYMRDDVTVAKL